MTGIVSFVGNMKQLFITMMLISTDQLMEVSLFYSKIKRVNEEAGLNETNLNKQAASPNPPEVLTKATPGAANASLIGGAAKAKQPRLDFKFAPTSRSERD